MKSVEHGRTSSVAHVRRHMRDHQLSGKHTMEECTEQMTTESNDNGRRQAKQTYVTCTQTVARECKAEKLERSVKHDFKPCGNTQQCR